MNDAAAADAAAGMTRESLLARARALVETVRERSDATEDARRLAPETMQAMRDAGIHRILQPARHGGAEAHFSGMVEIVEAISIACSAAGWCLTQYCSHNCLLGYWPPQGQDEIWGAVPDAMVAGVLIPSCGRARKVDGGWRIGGRWPFASGVYGADWFIATAFTEGGDRPRVAQMHAVPCAEFEIIDTWHTAGLRGTGSADVAIHDIFVPERRALPIDATKGGGDAPGCAVNAAALYRLPAFAMFSINQSAVAVGVAQATYDAFVARTRDRVARMSGKSMADYATAQVKSPRPTPPSRPRGCCCTIAATQAWRWPGAARPRRCRSRPSSAPRRPWRASSRPKPWTCSSTSRAAPASTTATRSRGRCAT